MWAQNWRSILITFHIISKPLLLGFPSQSPGPLQNRFMRCLPVQQQQQQTGLIFGVLRMTQSLKSSTRYLFLYQNGWGSIKICTILCIWYYFLLLPFFSKKFTLMSPFQEFFSYFPSSWIATSSVRAALSQRGICYAFAALHWSERAIQGSQHTRGRRGQRCQRLSVANATAKRGKWAFSVFWSDLWFSYKICLLLLDK